MGTHEEGNAPPEPHSPLLGGAGRAQNAPDYDSRRPLSKGKIIFILTMIFVVVLITAIILISLKYEGVEKEEHSKHAMKTGHHDHDHSTTSRPSCPNQDELIAQALNDPDSEPARKIREKLEQESNDISDRDKDLKDRFDEIMKRDPKERKKILELLDDYAKSKESASTTTKPASTTAPEIQGKAMVAPLLDGSNENNGNNNNNDDWGMDVDFKQPFFDDESAGSAQKVTKREPPPAAFLPFENPMLPTNSSNAWAEEEDKDDNVIPLQETVMGQNYNNKKNQSQENNGQGQKVDNTNDLMGALGEDAKEKEFKNNNQNVVSMNLQNLTGRAAGVECGNTQEICPDNSGCYT